MSRVQIPVCPLCGRLHRLEVCNQKKKLGPLERPPQNGVYKGRLKVRVLPPGVSGETNQVNRKHLENAGKASRRKWA